MQRYFEKHEYNHDSKQSDPNADTDTHTHTDTHDTSAFVPTDTASSDHMVGEQQ